MSKTLNDGEPVTELWPTFSFALASERVQFIKLQLLRGFSIAIDPVYIDQANSLQALIYNPELWSTEEIREVAVTQSELGINEFHGLSVHALGSPNRETALIDETLSAGFSVYLIVDVSTAENVVGFYILRASIADNS